MPTRVRVEVDRGVAVVTLDGPETLNSFTSATGRELGAAYRELDDDEAVRAIVLTGAGRAFCSGADLSTDPFASPQPGFSSSPVDPPAFRLGTFVVAAVNGHAIGIGLTLALQCDVRIAASEARLSVPQVRFGVLGDAQVHWTLRRTVGLAHAADLLLTGRAVTGDEAAAMGVVNRAVPADQVLPAALAVAHDVAAHCDPASVRESKQILWSDLDADGVRQAETDAHLRVMGRGGRA